MGKEKSVSGKIYKIVSCEEKSRYRRTFKREWYTEDEYEQRHHFELTTRFDMQTDLEYEYLFHKETKWDDAIEEYIPSLQIWYEYEMIVKYLYRNHTYEKQLKWEWHTKTLEEGQAIYLLIDRNKPEEIVQISTNNNCYKTLLYLSGILIVCMLFVLAIYLFI